VPRSAEVFAVPAIATLVNRSWRPGPLLSAAAALALLAYLIVDFRVFPFEARFPDEGRFIEEAVKFAATGEFWGWNDRAFEMPLTGVLYGAIYSVVGSEAGLFIVARSLQAVLLVVQAWLCADLARRLFDDVRAASLAFIGVLAYPMFIAFQSLLLSEALFIFLLVLAVWCLYRWAEAGYARRWLIAYAVAAAAATYTKATLTWLPVLLPALLILRPAAWKQIVRATALAGLVYALCLAPWWIRNARLFDQPVWFTTSASSNLYLGNNRANVRAGNEWDRDAETPFVASISGLPEVERDRRYRARAIEYVRAEPLEFVRNAGRKLVRFWNVVPNHESFRQGAYEWAIALSYGPALVLAVVAAWLYRRRWRRLLPIYALIGYFTLVHVVTISSLRYRLPLEPFLIIFAAGALAFLSRRLSPNRRAAGHDCVDTAPERSV
jgi:4-amino-4-deoxy-L-arabinose transferase-like glycosyltransferase